MRLKAIRNGLVFIFLTLLLIIPLRLIESSSNRLAAATAVDPLAIRFSSPTGIYQQAITLHITAPHPDAQILFTTDGSRPTPGNATIYTGPLYLPADLANVAAVRARAVLPDGTLGPAANTTYFLGVEATIPMISLLADPDDLWDEGTGIIANPLEHGIDWERPVTLTYLDENGRFAFQTDAGLRIHGLTSRKYEKKSFRLYFRGEYGTPWLQYPLFPGSDVNTFKRLVLHAGGQEFPFYKANGTLLRNHLVANLAEQLDGNAAKSRPVVLFINGELWGIYNLHERIDENFLTSHYGIDPLEGDVEHWERLRQFVQTHDLSNSANYTYLQTQMDVANFADYTIFQMIVANNDWPQNNISRFRGHTQGGRWQWIFWDTDFAFGLAPGSNVATDMVNHVLHDQSWFLLLALLQNLEFRDLFLTRTADLLNTTFLPEKVIAEIDILAAELEPNINYEINRWPGSGNWLASVEEMRDFARRRPAIMRQHVVDGFGLEGTAVFTFNPPQSNGGTAAVNDYLLPALPWQGTCFAGTMLRLTAVPDPGFQFAGWEPATLPQTAVIALPVTTDQTITPRFVPASATVPQPGDVRINNVGYDEEITLAGNIVMGDWIELVVQRSGGVDLRGWRLTDNDTKTSTDEGSLIFGQHTALTNVSRGTSVWVVVPDTAVTNRHLLQDDLNGRDRQLVLYTHNGNVDTITDPWFNLGRNDSLALLAPGPATAFGDDQGVDFITIGGAGSSGKFGILQDGVIGRQQSGQ